MKFHLPDGTDTDLVTHSYNGFPTATAAEFRGLLLAVAASGPDAPKPTLLEKFFETHPNVALERIAGMVDARQIATSVGAVLPLAELHTAHEMMEGMRSRPREKIEL